MTLNSLKDLDVTIAVIPRERFSYTRESLESVYENTEVPFKLIYVDGGSPYKVRRYLKKQANEKGFKLIQTSHYLSPNRARNLALSQVSSKYVVFVDNDVVVAPGWLAPLVECAEETRATIVSPLICQGTPIHKTVHCAGGVSGVFIENKDNETRYRIREKIYLQGKCVEEVQDQLKRQETGLAEFHCMLVRTDIFEKVGLLDEELLNTKEHVDFCITVTQAGGSIYLEPHSVVTYVQGPPLEWTDLSFYMLRWSDAWELKSLQRLRDKWNLTEDAYFLNRYKNVGWRRRMTIIRPLSRNTLSRWNSNRVERILNRIDKRLNSYITSRYTRKYL